MRSQHPFGGLIMLSKEQILEKAIYILNTHGISHLSMRSIAKELNVAAPSLYFHIKDKQEIYQLIVEHISSAVLSTIIPESNLQDICFALRTELKKIKDSPHIFIETPPITDNRNELIRVVMKKLEKFGVSKKHFMTSGNLLNNYVLLFVIDETIVPIDNAEIPKFFPLIEMLDYDEQFEFGINVILEGLKISAKK